MFGTSVQNVICHSLSLLGIFNLYKNIELTLGPGGPGGPVPPWGPGSPTFPGSPCAP